MNRTIALLLSVCMLFALTACSGRSSVESDLNAALATSTVKTTEPETTAAETTAAGTTAAGTDDSSSSDSSGDFTFNSSDGLDDRGYFEGVRALDYVTLPEYTPITLPADVHTPTDEAMDERISEILEMYSYPEEITDRAVEDGDTVNIDFVGSIDGEEFEGGSTEGAGTTVTIGETSYIDDFLEQLIGHMPGETFDVNVTFPDDYSEESLAGKDAVFVTTINYIEGETLVPELTDEFVEKNYSAYYSWTTVEEFRENVRQNLISENTTTYVQNYLLENSVISSVPSEIIQYEENRFLDNYNTYATYYGCTLDEMIQMISGYGSREELLEANAETIENSATYYLLLQAVAEDAGIESSEEALTAYFEENMGTSDYSDYEETYGKPYLHFVILTNLVTDYLVENTVNG